MMLWQRGGGRKSESCDVAYVEGVHELVREIRLATVVLFVMLAILTGVAGALIWVLRAPVWVIYADR